jgi:hypothetical protein
MKKSAGNPMKKRPNTLIIISDQQVRSLNRTVFVISGMEAYILKI